MKKRGVTLIEIMIAIFVFGIGIITILNIVSKNISVVDGLKTQTTATFLAKEGIELVFHNRDTNLLNKRPRNCFKIDGNDCIYPVNGTITSGYYSVELLDGKPVFSNIVGNFSDFKSTFDSFRLYFNSGYSYTKDGGVASDFARFIRISQLNGVSSDYLVKLESVVLFQRGGKTGEVVLNSFLGRIE